MIVFQGMRLALFVIVTAPAGAARPALEVVQKYDHTDDRVKRPRALGILPLLHAFPALHSSFLALLAVAPHDFASR